METYKHFPSGQKLLGLFLVQIHDVFTYQVIGKDLTDEQVDAIIQEKIVDKIIEDIGLGFTQFTLTPRHVRGMICYLADRCYVRWDELKSVQVQLRSTRDRYKTDDHPLTEKWINAQISNLNKEIAEIVIEIEGIEEQMFSDQFSDRLTLNDQKQTFERVTKLQTEIGHLNELLNIVNLDITEAKDFIQAMERKVSDLTHSNAVVEEFEYLDFDICPACMGLVEDHQIEGGCSLCKQPFNKDDATDRSAKMLNEAISQRDRSVAIQKERIVEAEKLKGEIAAKTLLWQDASRYYSISLRSPTTQLRARLRDPCSVQSILVDLE